MPWLPKQTVVVPIDFSEHSFSALDTAVQLVAGPENLHVIHVLPRMESTEPGYIWGLIDDEARRKHATDALVERLAQHDVVGANIVIAIGDPGREIPDFAESLHADLIVLPSHGRTGISRLLIGSVAERVVRRAHCPVLVLRP
jgi:nucleotide-binding universal stress UspA family protein